MRITKMTTEKQIIGAYILLIQNKQNITWKDILVAQRESLPEDGIPFDASLWNSAKQLVSALEKNESVFK